YSFSALLICQARALLRGTAHLGAIERDARTLRTANVEMRAEFDGPEKGIRQNQYRRGASRTAANAGCPSFPLRATRTNVDADRPDPARSGIQPARDPSRAGHRGLS